MIISTIFAPNWFRIVYLLFGLKGNRVQIPDSPAAVKLCIASYQSANFAPLTEKANSVGKVPVRCRVSQKTCHS